MKKLILLLFVISITKISAQEQDVESYIELLRMDVKTAKNELITKGMQFTEKEAEVFWPVYREYQFELDKLNDQRIALIKDYAVNFSKLTDEKAKELVGKNLDNLSDRIKLKEKYFDKFAEVITYIRAAKVMQIENQIQLLIDLQIATEMPFAEKPENLK
ncbi:MAG TPA: hypothetical protein VH917_06500 [Ignavibacteriaceae bacterium]|jgi:hypothetical protein